MPSASRRTLPSEPVFALRSVPIVENGEPLVDFLVTCPGLLLDAPRFQYRRATLLRASVATRLCQAEAALHMQGFRLALVEGWRAPHIQRRMYLATRQRLESEHPEWPETRLRRVTDRYSAPITDPNVPPPHVTGGAVDLFLAYPDGTLCDHHSPYDAFDGVSYAFAAPGLSNAARTTRHILENALTAAGLTNYPAEYWHWSYGDQGWAYRGGHPHALYGATQPENYSPDPTENVEDPLLPASPE